MSTISTIGAQVAEIPRTSPAPFRLDPLQMYGVSRRVDGAPAWTDTERLRTRAQERCTGDRRWRGWKHAQLDALLELSQQAERVNIVDVNLEGDFNALVHLIAPAPRWPIEGRLRIAGEVVLHLNYQSHWLIDAPPSWQPVGIMFPFDPYLPNASVSPRSSLCCGAIPPGIPPVELLMLGYYAVSLQTAMLDELEGVMNAQACEYFREHPEYMPLTRAGILDAWSPADLELYDAILDTEGGAL